MFSFHFVESFVNENAIHKKEICMRACSHRVVFCWKRLKSKLQFVFRDQSHVKGVEFKNWLASKEFYRSSLLLIKTDQQRKDPESQCLLQHHDHIYSGLKRQIYLTRRENKNMVTAVEEIVLLPLPLQKKYDLHILYIFHFTSNIHPHFVTFPPLFSPVVHSGWDLTNTWSFLGFLLH